MQLRKHAAARYSRRRQLQSSMHNNELPHAHWWLMLSNHSPAVYNEYAIKE